MAAYQALLFSILGTWVLPMVLATLIKPRLYEIENVNSTCNLGEMKVRLELNKMFQGIVYAKGYPLEKNCRSVGTGNTFVDLSIEMSGCGVRIVSTDDKILTFKVVLTVQMDKYLQQISDLELSVSCKLPLTQLTHLKQIHQIKQIGRTGRNKAARGRSSENYNENDFSSQIKTWMEIEGTSESSNSNKVAVGEQTMMFIKSFLPEDVSANVVDCYAYDGTRDIIQKLIDDNGCPIDETLMPPLEVIKYEDMESTSNEIGWDGESERGTVVKLSRDHGKKKRMRMQVFGTMFSAFKFPDSSNLHLKCTLQICKKKCPTVSCDSSDDLPPDRVGKSVRSDKNSGSIIDKIEVFNSVEVLAPGIDSEGLQSSNPDESDPGINLEKNSFCLSASKMAFSFAILGAVFLCGVLAALWTVMRNHMRKANKVDGSEQILVVRDSPMNFANFKNKNYHNWSYS